MDSNSPFSKTHLVPIEDAKEYSRKDVIFGLRKPDGSIIINFEHGTRFGVLKDIARITGCEVVQVKGTWTFTPDRIEDAKESSNDDN